MTEEEKKAIKWTYEQLLEQAKPTADGFVAMVEAKLSPKHPPKGAICEVRRWLSDALLSKAWVAYSDGQGGFTEYADGSGNVQRDFPHNEYHYREIPTAKDALGAIDEAVKHGGSHGVMDMYYYLRDHIKDLIDNAMEG